MALFWVLGWILAIGLSLAGSLATFFSFALIPLMNPPLWLAGLVAGASLLLALAGFSVLLMMVIVSWQVAKLSLHLPSFFRSGQG